LEKKDTGKVYRREETQCCLVSVTVCRKFEEELAAFNRKEKQRLKGKGMVQNSSKG